VYKTINLTNGKYYIGVHNVDSVSGNSYLGSGKSILRAIKKHGRKSFIKEVLFEFDSREEAFLKEEELVTIEVAKDPRSYNCIPGGAGGRGCIGELNGFYGKKHSKETRVLLSKNHHDVTGSKNPRFGKSHSEETRLKISTSHIGKKLGPPSAEHRRKISEAKKGKRHTPEAIQRMKDAIAARKMIA
jgi:group I intron endonuclease